MYLSCYETTEVNGILKLKSIYLREDIQIQRWRICWATLRISRSSVPICTHLWICLLITFAVRFVIKLEWVSWSCDFSFDSCFVDMILQYWGKKKFELSSKEFVLNSLEGRGDAEIPHKRKGTQRNASINTVRN